MTTIELIGALLGIAYVLLEYKASMWMWLFGFLMDICYCYVYFNGHLYANATLYVYYLVMCIVGAAAWMRNRKKAQREDSKADAVRSMKPWGWISVAGMTAALTLLLVYALSALAESQTVWLDALTSSLSCVGMILIAKKYYQQWLVWIIVDPVYVVLSLRTAMYPLAAMYLFYTIISIMGYIRWKRLNKTATEH
jgi:nicotinamide mononucleotide transporter